MVPAVPNWLVALSAKVSPLPMMLDSRLFAVWELWNAASAITITATTITPPATVRMPPKIESVLCPFRAIEGAFSFCNSFFMCSSCRFF